MLPSIQQHPDSVSFQKQRKFQATASKTTTTHHGCA
jgi:hypothetical protein